MRTWQATPFHTGECVHKFKDYYAYYIGAGYGSDIRLGGEEEFKHCAGFYSGVTSYDYWIKSELDKLNDVQIAKLELILRRNTLFIYSIDVEPI